MEDYKTTHCLATIISDLRDDNKALEDIIHAKNNRRNKDANKIAELKAELDKVKKGNIDTIMDVGLDNERLQAENKKLQSNYIKLEDKYNELNSDYKNDIDASYELDDKHVDIIKDLERKIKEHEKQYNMLASSKSSHYPKEIKDEADEYFHHNPQCEKLFFFMVGGDEVDEDGDITRTLNVECDTMAECDNISNNVHVEVYK